jgi:hypothetical protein
MKESEYTIERHSHGWLVFGELPLNDFAAIAALPGSGGVLHCGIASYYDAVLAMGRPAEIETWQTEIEDSLKGFEPAEYRFAADGNSLLQPDHPPVVPPRSLSSRPNERHPVQAVGA